MTRARAGVVLCIGSALVLSIGGCGGTPPCKTSLVTLDETRLDAETYEQEQAETAKNINDLEQRLSTKKKEVDSVKDKPDELRKQVEDLKKGSGRQ
jgi:septal ring factor EnvC (AmiA/AmiB activator)